VGRTPCHSLLSSRLFPYLVLRPGIVTAIAHIRFPPGVKRPRLTLIQFMRCRLLWEMRRLQVGEDKVFSLAGGGQRRRLTSHSKGGSPTAPF
jgi:hypothetical protein